MSAEMAAAALPTVSLVEDAIGRSLCLPAPDDLSRLRAFHAVHFPNQETPPLDEVHASAEEDDLLGYYSDGVKRRLTSDQIEIFRHSEVQRILQERRWKAETSEVEEISHKDTVPKPDRKAAEKRKPVCGGDSEGPADQPHRQFRFFDEPSESAVIGVNLNYDDEGEKEVNTLPKEKKFIWPKLG